MRALRRFLRRLTSWATTRQNEERLRTEIEEHLALQTAENIREGLPPQEARRQAALKFGGVEAIKEQYREQRGLPVLETLAQDARHSLRRLRMAPAFTIATVVTLALGIGATTSIFTLVHAVLLKSLPVARPEELYRLGRESNCCYKSGYSSGKEFSMVSYDLYTYLRDHTQGFVELAAFPAGGALFGIRRAGSTEAAQSYPGEYISGNYFRMFGVEAYRGRMLTPEDDRPGAPAAAVMSYRLWQQKYGGDPSLLGSVFQVNDRPVTVVGVTPPGFYGDTLRNAAPDFFLPLNAEPYVETDADLRKYATHWLDLIGRIQPGANPSSIEAQMRIGLKQWLAAHWGEMSAADRAKFPFQTLYLSPGGAGITSMREQYEHWLRILLLLSGLVLLTVCANVANLLLVRGMERRRQTSLSMALGARLSRVVQQGLTESVLLSLFGGTAGLAVSFGLTRLILHFAFPARPGFSSVPIDASPSMPVLLFALLVSLLTGIAFGLVPAWMATRIDPMEALRDGSRSTARTGSLPRKALVILQAAFSLVLLSAAGLLTATLANLEKQDFGFHPERRVVLRTDPRLGGYRPDQLSLLYRRLHDAFGNTPGVASVALCLYAPQSGGNWRTGVWIDGHPPPDINEEHAASWSRVTAGYFDVVGTAIVRGRGITEQDTVASRKVAVVNQAFVRRYFPNEDPIGKHFGDDAAASGKFEIIGVAQNTRHLTMELDQPVYPFFYVPEAQANYAQRNAGSLFLSDIVVLPGPGATVSAGQLREALASVDPDLPVVWIRTMKDQVAGQLVQQRLIARLTSLFGLLSLLLAAVGIYGMTAYNAARRVNEIGVRMALGANRGDVVRLVLHGAFGLILAGLGIGLPLALGVGRVLENQLYGTGPVNFTVLLAATAALAVSGFVASVIPAVRASTASPVDALRAE